MRVISNQTGVAAINSIAAGIVDLLSSLRSEARPMSSFMRVSVGAYLSVSIRPGESCLWRFRSARAGNKACDSTDRDVKRPEETGDEPTLCQFAWR